MKRLAGAIAVAIAVALALGTSAEASPKLTKQQFVVNFKGEHGQDWSAQWDDDEKEPVCLYGYGAYGSSELHTATTGPEVSTFYVNRKHGVALGSVPANAILAREFHRGGLPPEDCRDAGYFTTPFNCDPAAVWSKGDKLQGATVDIQAQGGKLLLQVTRKDEDSVLERVFGDRCPFVGVDEGKIEGSVKLSKKKLFSGEPQKLKFEARHDFPAPADHNVEGLQEWTLTIKALKPKKGH
jgi:hypothetical protein